MHILFYHPFQPQRNTSFSYSSVQNAAGFSGTETALAEVSKYLVDRNHAVTIVGISQRYHESDGIVHAPFEHVFEHIKKQKVDIFCPLFYLGSVESSQIISLLTKDCIIWIWMHCFVDNHYINPLAQSRRVVASFLSPFVEMQYSKQSFLSTRVIGNAIGRAFLEQPPPDVTTPPKKGKWTFHASFERGGLMAYRVFKYVQNKRPDACTSIHYASYFAPDSSLIQPLLQDVDVHWHSSLPKNKIASLLNEADYFVYPLVLPDAVVHHDTFASVVLEALASGVIVVTWNVACIPHVYGDYVIQVEPDDVPGYDRRARYGRNAWMLTDEAVQRLGEKILYLEEHPEEKEILRERGRTWAKTQTWDVVGKQYEEWLRGLRPRTTIL